MELTDLRDEFRSQVSDEQQPFLWSDSEFDRYLIDAQDMYVRLTGGISDSTTTAIVDLSVRADKPWAAFSPYVLRVRSAKLVTAKTDVRIVQEGDLAQILTDDYGLRTAVPLDDEDTGTVVAGILGLDEYKVRWYKVPSTDDTCRMHVFRLPYPRIETWDGGVPLEIPEHHHRHLLMWMKHLAYSKSDAECFDKGKADQNRVEFEAYCVRAKQEKERVSYRPRRVAYGGC